MANRFQIALYREMLYVIEQGILSVERPRMRPSAPWARLPLGRDGPEPVQTAPWSGCAGGSNHFAGPNPHAARGSRDEGPPGQSKRHAQSLKPGVISGVIRGKLPGARSINFAQEENRALIGLLKLRAESTLYPRVRNR